VQALGSNPKRIIDDGLTLIKAWMNASIKKARHPEGDAARQLAHPLHSA
jgi:hypothetical protein